MWISNIILEDVSIDKRVRVLERDQRFCVLHIFSAHLHVFKSSCQVALRRVLTKNSKWVERSIGKSWFSKVNSDRLIQFLFVSSLSLSSWTFLYYVLCKILLLKSRKSNRTRYFLHTGLTGWQNNPKKLPLFGRKYPNSRRYH